MRKSLVAVLVTCVLPVLVAHPAEATTPTSVTAYAGAISHQTTTSVVAGDAVHLVGVYSGPGSTTAGVPLDLWAKPYGGDWARVLSRTTDSAGRTFADRAPSTRTLFQWRFAGDEQRDPSSSNLVTVKVATRIGLKVADATIGRGQRVVVSGRTRPAKRGATVVLWYSRPTGRVRLASTSVRRDATYRISKAMGTRGSYALYVTVEAARGNLAGVSVIRSLTVR